MELSSLLATMNPSQAAAGTKSKKTLGQEDFMNLFVTQMRSQNPLEPMDNSQMVAQLAQFNNVEALQNLSIDQKLRALSGQHE